MPDAVLSALPALAGVPIGLWKCVPWLRHMLSCIPLSKYSFVLQFSFSPNNVTEAIRHEFLSASGPAFEALGPTAPVAPPFLLEGGAPFHAKQTHPPLFLSFLRTPLSVVTPSVSSILPLA